MAPASNRDPNPDPNPDPFHIAVFTRAPLPGRAKTRLIPLLGAAGAAALQRQMTLYTLALACSAAPGQVSLWAADAPDDPFFAECARRFGLICHSQCEGDLGARMADCLRRQLLQNERVLLIGTDCLAWSETALQAAARALAAGARMVFTPAEDGGYVLVGARRHGALEAPPPQAFWEISWGSAQVLAQTRARLAALGWQPGREWRELPSLWDIDTPQDYLRAQQAGLLAGDLAPE